VREALGPDKIAALMTTTPASLSQPREIIDEYLRQGFRSVFLRSISPYGFATRTGLDHGYEMESWLEFYKAGLDYILDLNYQGVDFREQYASIILRKILTPYGTGYVDLQSPAGMGISVIVFNYDGDVYATDEARMLAEMGDHAFRLGNLFSNSYEEIMLSDKLLNPLAEAMAECVPSCVDCGVQPYCGSDPVYHHRVQGDPIGYKPTSGFCKKNMGVIRHLIHLLEDDRQAADVLRRWA
jgi:His-Xaa-Ser system radical SAM maturase HxsB